MVALLPTVRIQTFSHVFSGYEYQRAALGMITAAVLRQQNPHAFLHRNTVATRVLSADLSVNTRRPLSLPLGPGLGLDRVSEMLSSRAGGIASWANAACCPAWPRRMIARASQGGVRPSLFIAGVF
jgi:hypothetical protein